MALTFTVLPQQLRQGTFTGGSAVFSKIGLTDNQGNIQINPDTGLPYAGFEIDGTTSTTDAQVGTNLLRITLWASWDGGKTWPWQQIYDWTGGIGPKGNYTLPEVSGAIPTDSSGKFPDRVRADLDTLTSPSGVNTGLSITFR